MSRDLTPSQTIGPFYFGTIINTYRQDLAPQGVAGERLEIELSLHDADGATVPDGLFEIWQANAAGRYVHVRDQHPAPLDPNFTGAGRALTDAEGHYRFVTVKPGAYPWRNHHNAWRPAHIHLSLFGPSYLTRLVTQMYFPGDPLLAFDPIYKSVPEGARMRLQAAFDMEATQPEWALAYRFDIETTIPQTALGYKFDIVLRGRAATPMVD